MKEFTFLIYAVEDSDITVNVIIKDETIWLSQKGMAELFGCSSDNISLHLKNIFFRRRTAKRFSYREILGNCQRRQKLPYSVLFA